MSEEEIYPPGAPTYLFVQANSTQVACLERVEEERLPAIVSTARTRCLWCDYWCWLGDNSMQLILSGEAAPMCIECATELVPGNAWSMGPINDTLRDEL